MASPPPSFGAADSAHSPGLRGDPSSHSSAACVDGEERSPYAPWRFDLDNRRVGVGVGGAGSSETSSDATAASRALAGNQPDSTRFGTCSPDMTVGLGSLSSGIWCLGSVTMGGVAGIVCCDPGLCL